MKNFKFILLLITLLSTGSSFAALRVGDRISEEIAAKDISLDLNLFNLNVGESVGFSGETGLRVFPNKGQQTYSRVEPLAFTLDVGGHIPVGIFSLGANNSTTITGEFFRQFDTQKEAFNLIETPPYIFDSNNLVTDKRIPFVSTQALRLKNKDYFRYQVRTAININAGLAAELGIVQFAATKSYVAYGDIQIEVYKKYDHNVLVRASSLKQKSDENSLSLKNGFIFDVYEFTPLNNLVNNILPSELIKIDLHNQTEGKLFAVEYEFDLSDPVASDAYDQMMDYRNWDFLDVAEVINPLNQNGSLQTLLMKIDQAESEAQKENGTVKRVTRSQTHFSNTSSGSSFDFKLIEATNKTNFVQQDISIVVDPKLNTRENYRIATLAINESIGGWLLFNWGQEERKEANALFELDEDRNIVKFMELNFSYERSDENFSKRNLRNTKGQIYKIIPPDLHGPGVRDFVQNLSLYKGDHVFVDADLIMEPRAFAFAASLTQEEINLEVKQFLYAIFADQGITNENQRDYGDQDLYHGTLCDKHKNKGECLRQNHLDEIKTIQATLPIIFRSGVNQNYDSQWAQLIELRKVKLFKKLGSGILSRLLMRAVLKNTGNYLDFYKLASVRLKVRGQALPPMVFKRGRSDRPEVFNELLKIRDRILNREYNPAYFEGAL